MKVKIWPFRRFVQIFIIIALFAFPIISRYSHYLTARQLDKLTEKWDGTFQGEILQKTDTLVRVGIPDGEGGVPGRRPRKAILKRTTEFYGSAWSAHIFGISLTDLLAGMESFMASHSLTIVLLIGLIIPLLATVFLGRIYCSWICPMAILFDLAEKCREWLKIALEISPLKITFWKYNKYVLLSVGLMFTFFLGYPLLHYIYPPAIFSKEAHSFIMNLFDHSEMGQFGFFFNGFTIASLFLLALFFIEVFIAPRSWCQTICPGGALYTLLSRFRWLKVKRNPETCTECALCDDVCPQRLFPMRDKMGMECANCAECIDVCPEDALSFRKFKENNRIKVVAIFLIAMLISFGTYAHHILGVPHYAYDENYPQAPVLKLSEKVDHWNIQLTGYPGNPKPAERSQIHVYIKNDATGAIYQNALKITVKQKKFFSSRVIFEDEKSELVENVFKFFLQYPSEGNYEIALNLYDRDLKSSLTFPIVIGTPGSPWKTIFGFLSALFFFILVIRSIRIKRARKLRMELV